MVLLLGVVLVPAQSLGRWVETAPRRNRSRPDPQPRNEWSRRAAAGQPGKGDRHAAKKKKKKKRASESRDCRRVADPSYSAVDRWRFICQVQENQED